MTAKGTHEVNAEATAAILVALLSSGKVTLPGSAAEVANKVAEMYMVIHRAVANPST